MSILITGVAGFIGSSVSLYLKHKGYRVLGIDDFSYGDRKNIHGPGQELVCSFFAREDIRNDLSYLLGDVDTVMHFAAISSLPECQAYPMTAYDVNVVGTISLLEQCRKHGIKNFLFASSNAVCENEYKVHNYNHLDNEPDLVYPMTKRACENICRSYNLNYGMNTKVMRFANVYGPNQNMLRKHPPLMGYIAQCLINDVKPTFYNRYISRNYTYIQDICEFCEYVMNQKVVKKDTNYVIKGQNYTVEEIYHSMMKAYDDSRSYPAADWKEPTEYWAKYPELFEGDLPLDKDRVRRECFKSTEKYDNITYKAKWDLDRGTKEIIDYVKTNI